MEEYQAKFLDNYEIKILNDTRRRAKWRRPVFFADPKNADVLYDDMTQMETETVFTLEIPESKLRALMELEQMFYKNRGTYPKEMFELIMEKIREESALRHQYSAVQKAYEQYSAALHLVGYERKI